MTDEQMEKVYHDAFCGRRGPTRIGLRAVAAAAFEEGVVKAYRDLQPKIDAVEQDAKRYKYLCEMAWGKPIGDGIHELQFRTFSVAGHWPDTKTVADAAIDSGMSEHPPDIAGHHEAKQP